MPIADADGRVSSVLGVSRDITDRKLAEQALQESESTARALLNAPTDTIILLDSRGVILDLNETAVLRLGRRREDLVGILSYTVLPTDLAQERMRRISEVMSTGKPIRFIDVHGATWFDNVVYPIPDNLGNVARLAVIARDITDQKNTEGALRESEERYRKLVEISPNAVLLHRDGKIIYANQALARILGAECADALIGRDIMDLIHTACRDVIRTNIAHDLAGMSTPFMELQMVRSDGTLITVQGQGVGISIDGKPAVLVAIRDVAQPPHPDPAIPTGTDC
jgi:PAS domain S-box-containing protein